MGMLNSVWYGKHEPPVPNVLWARPMDGGFAFYIYDGKWKPMKIVDDQKTYTTDDDKVIPLEEAEVKNVYQAVYVGVGSSASDILLPENYHDELQSGDSLTFTEHTGYLYLISDHEELPELTMNSFDIPMSSITAVVGGTSYHGLRSDNEYDGSFTVEIV